MKMMAKKAYVSPMAEQRCYESDVLLTSQDNIVYDREWSEWDEGGNA